MQMAASSCQKAGQIPWSMWWLCTGTKEDTQFRWFAV